MQEVVLAVVRDATSEAARGEFEEDWSHDEVFMDSLSVCIFTCAARLHKD